MPCRKEFLTRLRFASDIAAFHRREDGSLTIFGLLLFILMMVGMGVALDIMRSETERAELQNAVDRAVLAAADLDQQRDIETVVRDYVTAQGLDPDMVDVVVDETDQYRDVLITTETRTNSLFLDNLGVDELVQPISTRAREEQTDLEISLVVDISGSMSGAKIASLRTAASSFVAELLDGREDQTTISLVPYNDRVNAGTTIASVFSLTQEHNHSTCVVFDDADFSRLDLPNGASLQRKGHFDFRSSHRNGNSAGLVADPNCRTDNYAAILPWSNDVTLLQNRISALNASHWTAMDLGVKWGALLLDPSSRDELQAMSTSGAVPADEQVDGSFTDRPVEYSNAGTNKVLVVMTDGVNTTQWDLKDSRRSGPSGIYAYRVCEGNCTDMTKLGNVYGQDGSACIGRADESLCKASFDDDVGGNWKIHYSFKSHNSNQFWSTTERRWRSTPAGGNLAKRLDWADAFSSLGMSYIANTLLSGATYDTRVDYFYSWETTHGQSSADANLSNICAEALSQGVVIYTIAFQAPVAGQVAMRDCAGSNNQSKYYDVTGLDISAAFDDILASVSRLRLTQ